MILFLKPFAESFCMEPCVGVLLSLLAGVAASHAAAADRPSTNSPPYLMSLNEVWKKWDKVPIEEVRRAAESGDTTAMVDLGHAYRLGDGVRKDSQEALKWFRLASERGDPMGTVSVGWMYGYDEGPVRHETAAVEYYLRAAGQGQVDAMYELYLSYWNGKGAAENRDEALKWLEKAAEGGKAVAQCEFGIRLERPSTYGALPAIIKPNNMPEAIRWYRRAAAQDFAGGYCRLGLCYLEGKGVEQDEQRGLDLIRKAADQAQDYSLIKLAELYDQGIGEPRGENDRPVNLLLRAAENNAAEAYPGLIFRYQRGLGTARDLVAASRWYCRAAMAHNRRYPLPDAATERQQDKTPPTDPFRAVLYTYIRAATHSDDPAAPLQIGEMYSTGRDAPQDPVRAWLWLDLAAQRGAGGAQSRLATFEASVSAKELEKARGLLSSLEQELGALAAFRAGRRQD